MEGKAHVPDPEVSLVVGSLIVVVGCTTPAAAPSAARSGARPSRGAQ